VDHGPVRGCGLSRCLGRWKRSSASTSGGTHTDVEVILGPTAARGKALTTYDDFNRGVLDAISVAADALDLDRAALLARTRLVVNGTAMKEAGVALMRAGLAGS